jgi:hypothetical protein
VPDLLRRKIPVRLVLAGATLAAVRASLLVLGIVMMNRVTSNTLADIHANAVVTKGVVAAQIEGPKRAGRLTIDYHVGGRPFEGNIYCYTNVVCEPIGTQLTVTADRRDPDEFVTADGRLVILLVIVGFICGVCGLGFLEYLRRWRHPGPPPQVLAWQTPARRRGFGAPPALPRQAPDSRDSRASGNSGDSAPGNRGTAGRRGPRSRP